MRVVAVVLVDPARQIRQSVGRQQQVQPAGDPQRLPRLGGGPGAAGPQPDRGERRLGVGVDPLEQVLEAEALDQLLGAARADVLDALEVGDDRVGVVGRQRAGLGDLDLASEAAVGHPLAEDPGALARLQVHEWPDQGDRRPVAGGRVEHRPAGLLVGEPHVPHGHRSIERSRLLQAHGCDVRAAAGGRHTPLYMRACPGSATHLLAPVNRARRGRADACRARSRPRPGWRSRSTTVRIPREPRRSSSCSPATGRRRRSSSSASRCAGGRRCWRGSGPRATRSRCTATATGCSCGSGATALLDDLRRGTRRDRGRARRATAPGTGRRTGSTARPAWRRRARRGCEPLLWSRWGKDWRRLTTPTRIARRAMRGLLPGDVILLHDADFYSSRGSHRRTAAAVEIILAELSRRKLCTVLAADVVARAHTG